MLVDDLRNHVFVFTGPTLSPEEGRRELDAIYLPPAAQGDVYSAARRKPWAIGIIDGYFERVPSVWHKEILWALSRGVHVFGSASMGALRAAELERFGMVGVGSVFRAFASGELEDDDEVTVVHGAAETGYRCLSEAMVNVRATLEAARRAGVIGSELCQRLVSAVKAMYYPERSYARMLQEATGWMRWSDEVEALAAFLPDGRIDRKRDDAVAMLREMRRLLDADPAPKRTRFPFHHTHMWEMLRCRLEERPLSSTPGAESQQPDALLEELRLQGNAYRYERERSLVRLLALEVAQQRGLEVDDAASSAELGHSVSDLGEEPGDLRALRRSESLVQRIRATYRLELDSHLRDHLRATGAASTLRARSRDKQIRLAMSGLDNPRLADVGLELPELWQWYFEECLKQPVPESPEAHATALDFESIDAMQRAVLREYCYRRLLESEAEERSTHAIPRTANGAGP